jgi:hypothetical protein
MKVFEALFGVLLVSLCVSFSLGRPLEDLEIAQNNKTAVIVARAISLIGQSKSSYASNQVLNYAVYGSKSAGGTCAWYRNNYGVACSSPQPAAVAISKDASNCAIFLTSAKFEYTSFSKGVVIVANTTNINFVFNNGYDLFCYQKGSNPVPQTVNPPASIGGSTALIVKRALSIIGQSANLYLSNQVINFALTGDKNNGGNCVSYRNWGVSCIAPMIATVAVSKDGSNCAIFTARNFFEYTSGSKGQVVLTTADQLRWVFPSGVDYRCLPKPNNTRSD